MTVTARASLTAELVGGRTRCTALRSDPPLTLRETATGVHLVASGAGPLGGDHLLLEVRIGPGASLDLRSVAASMVHPGPSGRPSRLVVDVAIAEDARLIWTPQPSILVRGCDHRVDTRIRLGTGASVVWREDVVLGRHDEESGSVLQRLRVDGPGGPVLRTDVALGPRWPGSLGPAGTGAGVRAVGSLLVVDPDAGELLAAVVADGGAGPGLGTDDAAARSGGDGVRWAASALPTPDSVLVTALAPSAGALRDRLDGLVARSVARRRSRDNPVTVPGRPASTG